MADRPDQERLSAFAARQAAAYDSLLPVYEANHVACQPIRQVVLDRILEGLPANASALDVGCGAGAYLELMAARGLNAQGIDSSSEMAQAARSRSGRPVVCGDFRQYRGVDRFDLVFAQAFVHLFPKAEIDEVIATLKNLAHRRVYFSTSLSDVSDEGWQHKDGAVRYRSRYTRGEFMNVVNRATTDGEWHAWSFELVDVHHKHWIQVVLDRLAVSNESVVAQTEE